MSHRGGGRDPKPGFVGVVCGLRSEAAVLRAAMRAVPGARRRIRVAVCGMRPEAAERAARIHAEAGAVSLLSFGLAGALDPELRVGDVVWTGRVLAEDDAWPAVPPVPEPSAAWHCVVVFGSDRLVGASEDRRALRTATGARAVDMESHRVARAAEEAGLPFAVLRAISDTDDQRLPPFLTRAVSSRGRARLLPVLAGLAREPAACGDLLALRRGTRRALAALRGAAVTLLRDMEGGEDGLKRPRDLREGEGPQPRLSR